MGCPLSTGAFCLSHFLARMRPSFSPTRMVLFYRPFLLLRTGTLIFWLRRVSLLLFVHDGAFLITGSEVQIFKTRGLYI